MSAQPKFHSFENTPSAISTEIRALCSELVPNQEPEFIRVTPIPDADPLDCFVTVARYAEQHGGSVCYGWQIWEWPRVMVEAEFHAVWLDSDGRFHDITPKQIPVNRILFLPDPGRKYDGRQVNNVRRPLLHDAEMISYIDACNKEFELLNRGKRAYQHGAITLDPSEALELEDIRNRKLRFEMQFLSAPQEPIRKIPRPGRNDPCPCGSGKKFKKCCGP
jgi:hypothetical protein